MAGKLLCWVKLTKTFVASPKDVSLVTHALVAIRYVYTPPIRTKISLALTRINWYERKGSFVMFRNSERRKSKEKQESELASAYSKVNYYSWIFRSWSILACREDRKRFAYNGTVVFEIKKAIFVSHKLLQIIQLPLWVAHAVHALSIPLIPIHIYLTLKRTRDCRR